LSFSGSALVFQGDSLKLRVPFAQIVRLRPKTIGWRGLFLYRPRLALTVSGLPDLNTLEFAERSSWVFPTALRNTHKLEAQLAARLQNRP
jgi:hypothetical protein